MHQTSPSSVLNRPVRNGLAWLHDKLDNKGLLDAGQGKAKGAAARKAAAKAAQARLRAAWEAALEAKNRVVLMHGVLYYAVRGQPRARGRRRGRLLVRGA